MRYKSIRELLKFLTAMYQKMFKLELSKACIAEAHIHRQRSGWGSS